MTREQAQERLRKTLDEWFPTIVRYCGVALLVYAVTLDGGTHLAYITAATGMILYKSVVGGRNGGGQ